MTARTKAKQYWTTKAANFMTPNAFEWITTPRFLVELSRGTGFDHQPIYGVSVAALDGTRGNEEHDLSMMFESEEDAREHIEGRLF